DAAASYKRPLMVSTRIGTERTSVLALLKTRQHVLFSVLVFSLKRVVKKKLDTFHSGFKTIYENMTT
ncbi:hypothetical protein PJH57_29060, partial [Mycobacterium kansasii]